MPLARNELLGAKHIPCPPRPTLTLVFMSSLFFWAACASTYATGAMRPRQADTFIAIVALTICMASIIMFVFKKTRLFGIIITSIAIGALLGSVNALSVHTDAQRFEGVSASADITVLEDSHSYGTGESVLATVAFPDCPSIVCTVTISKCEPLIAGQQFRSQVSFRSADFSKNKYAWADGSCGTCKTLSEYQDITPSPIKELVQLRKAIIEAIGADDESHALLQALVCGYRRNIKDTDLYTSFQACGLAHLVAVSGAHLVIVTGLFASVLKCFRAPRKLTIGMLIAVMASYYIIAGMPVSALRASVMSTLGLLSFFGGRRPSSLNSIGIGLYAIISLSPASSVSASLVLSALSTIGIVLFAPLVSAWLDRIPLLQLPFIAEPLSLTLSASLLSQLYACSLFNLLPVVAPLANVVSAPLFPLACGIGLIAGIAMAIAPPLAPLISQMSGLVSGILAGAVHALSLAPVSSIPFAIDTAVALAISAGLAFALWISWPQPRAHTALIAAVLACLVACLIPLLHDSSDKLVMLDVGQGDAILVESRGTTLLIDTGNEDALLIEQLAKQQIIHIDSVLVTHADDDHCGSLEVLSRSVSIDRIILAQGMLECSGDSAQSLVEQSRSIGCDIVGVGLDDEFRVGAFTAHIVWPHEFTQEGGNADSLCISLEHDGNDDGISDTTAFLTGDAEKEQIEAMVQEGRIGHIDILKVGHHGSRNGLTTEEAATLHPSVALVSCGMGNRYGHPAPETVNTLESVGAALFRTDLNGCITCKLTPERITVSCEKDN